MNATGRKSEIVTVKCPTIGYRYIFLHIRTGVYRVSEAKQHFRVSLALLSRDFLYQHRGLAVLAYTPNFMGDLLLFSSDSI